MHLSKTYVLMGREEKSLSCNHWIWGLGKMNTLDGLAYYKILVVSQEELASQKSSKDSPSRRRGSLGARQGCRRRPRRKARTAPLPFAASSLSR